MKIRIVFLTIVMGLAFGLAAFPQEAEQIQGRETTVTTDKTDSLPDPYEFFPVDFLPEPVYEEVPDYPEEARGSGIKVSVFVKSLVGTDGNVIEAIILTSSRSELGFDEAALESAYKCTYKPALQGDQPVPYWVTSEYEFIPSEEELAAIAEAQAAYWEALEAEKAELAALSEKENTETADTTAVTEAGPVDSSGTGELEKTPSLSELETAIRELDSAEYLPGPDEFVAVDSPAVMIYQPTPIFPKQAVAAGIMETEVWVKALVDRNGTVRRVEISKSPELDLGFDNAALEAAYKCRFKPAVHNDSTVAMWTSFNVEFDVTAQADSSAADLPVSKKLPDAVEIAPADSSETDAAEPIDSSVFEEPAGPDTAEQDEAGGDTLTEIIPIDSSAVEKPDSTDWPVPVEKAVEIIHEEPPVYPEQAKKDKVEASVWIKALVDTAGVIQKLEVSKPSEFENLGFEEAALEAAGKYKFKPAIQDGQPAEVWVSFEIKFELTDSD